MAIRLDELMNPPEDIPPAPQPMRLDHLMAAHQATPTMGTGEVATEMLDPRIQGALKLANPAPDQTAAMVGSLQAQLAHPLAPEVAPTPIPAPQPIGATRNLLGAALNSASEIANLPIRGLGELGIIDPTTAAQMIHTQLAPEQPGLSADIGHVIGGAAPAIAAGPLAPAVMAAQGAEGAQEITEELGRQGTPVDESSRLADVGGQAALGWVMGRMFGKNINSGIAKTYEGILAKRLPQLVSRYGGRATAGMLLGEAQQVGSNIVTKETVKPEQDITAGVPGAMLTGGLQEAGMGAVHEALHGAPEQPATPEAAPESPVSAPEIKPTSAFPEELPNAKAVGEWYSKQFGDQQNAPTIEALASTAGNKKFVRKDVPIGDVAPNDTMPGDTQAEKVQNFVQQPAETQPPIIAIPGTDTPYTVADGGHRLAAAKARGDKTISAYVPEEPAAMIGGAHSSLSAAGAHDPFMDPQSGKSSLQNLTDQISKVVPPKAPLFRQMTMGAKAGEELPVPKDSGPVATVVGGYNRLKGGLASMFNAFKSAATSVAGSDTYDLATRKWSGADNTSALEIERFRKSTLKAVPDKLDRAAIAIAIEAGGDQATLEKWNTEIQNNPKAAKYAEAFARATKLSDDHKLIAQSVAVRNEATLHEAQAADLLKDGVDNYLMHVWEDNPKALRRIAAESNFNSLITKPGFTKQRRIPTYFEGIQEGYTPKDLDFASLTAAHERAFREALAARAYIKTLTETKAEDGRPLVTVSPSTAREVPPAEGGTKEAYLVKGVKPDAKFDDYRVVDHPALRGWKWAGADSAGKPILVQGDMLVHPDIYRSIKNNLGRSALQTFEVHIGDTTIKPGAALLKVSSELKHAILSLSAFHQTTLGIHALEHRVNPIGTPDIDLANPTHKALIDHGMMVAHYNGAEQFGEGVQGGGLLSKTPLLGPKLQQYQDYLFKDYLPRIKMAMATEALARNQNAYGDSMTSDQILSMTADQANAAFGGLNYRVLGRNKTFQDVLRLGLMAPDFLEARARFVGQGVRKGGREQRTALMVGALGMYTAARVLNKLADDDFHWDKPFTLVYGGKEYELRTIQGDLDHLIADPMRFARNRLSPLASYAGQMLFGVGRYGNPESRSKITKEAITGNVPIPVQELLRQTDDPTSQRAVEALLKATGINVRKENVKPLE